MDVMVMVVFLGRQEIHTRPYIAPIVGLHLPIPAVHHARLGVGAHRLFLIPVLDHRVEGVDLRLGTCAETVGPALSVHLSVITLSTKT